MPAGTPPCGGRCRHPLGQCVWRQMDGAILLGDAITTREALRRGVHAQCSLATTRNLFRDQSFSMEELAASCPKAAQDYLGDIHFPDWPRVMQPLRREGEVIKRFDAAQMPIRLLADVRLAACILTHRTHVIAALRDGPHPRFRVYNNDSPERLQGRPADLRELRGVHMNATFFAVMAEDSALSLRVGGEGLTTCMTERRRERRSARTWTVPTVFD